MKTAKLIPLSARQIGVDEKKALTDFMCQFSITYGSNNFYHIPKKDLNQLREI